MEESRWMNLARDLQLQVLGLIEKIDDCASFVLADPRTGRAAMRHLPSFQDPILHVAMQTMKMRRQLSGSAMGICVEPGLETAYAYLDDARLTVRGAIWLKSNSSQLGGLVISSGMGRGMFANRSWESIQLTDKRTVIWSDQVCFHVRDCLSRTEGCRGSVYEYRTTFFDGYENPNHTTHRKPHERAGEILHHRDRKTYKKTFEDFHRHHGLEIVFVDTYTTHKRYSAPHPLAGAFEEINLRTMQMVRTYDPGHGLFPRREFYALTNARDCSATPEYLYSDSV